MSVVVFLFGALNIDLPKQNRSLGRGSTLVLSDVLLILGLGLALLVVLTALVYVWMKFRRKRRRHVSSGEKVYRDAAEGAEEHGHVHADGSDEDDDQDDHDHDYDHHGHHNHNRRRYKYRVRRRTHRSRNPTLSETGGLPPVKAQEPTKPC